MRVLFPSTKKKCSRCGSTDVSRTKRGFFSKLLSFGRDVRKYRCDKCFHSFYVLVKPQYAERRVQ